MKVMFVEVFIARGEVIFLFGKKFVTLNSASAVVYGDSGYWNPMDAFTPFSHFFEDDEPTR